jgi:hypothetical protein
MSSPAGWNTHVRVLEILLVLNVRGDVTMYVSELRHYCIDSNGIGKHDGYNPHNHTSYHIYID